MDIKTYLLSVGICEIERSWSVVSADGSCYLLFSYQLTETQTRSSRQASDHKSHQPPRNSETLWRDFLNTSSRCSNRLHKMGPDPPDMNTWLDRKERENSQQEHGFTFVFIINCLEYTMVKRFGPLPWRLFGHPAADSTAHVVFSRPLAGLWSSSPTSDGYEVGAQTQHPEKHERSCVWRVGNSSGEDKYDSTLRRSGSALKM